MFISFFSIIPDSAMKMYSNWLHQSVDLLHYIDTFMFPGVFTPFWNTKQCYGLNHMSLLYYKSIYNRFHCTFMLLMGCCPVPAQMWKHLCACSFRVGKEIYPFSLCKPCILMFWQSPYENTVMICTVCWSELVCPVLKCCLVEQKRY